MYKGSSTVCSLPALFGGYLFGLKSSSHKPLNNFENISLIAAASLLAFPWAAMLGSTLVVSSYADPVFAICFVHIFMLVMVTDDLDRLIVNNRHGMLQFSSIVNPNHYKTKWHLSGRYHGVWIFVLSSVERVLKKGACASASWSVRAWDFALGCCALLGYLLWLEYAARNSIPKSFGLRPPEEWNFDVLNHSFFNARSVQWSSVCSSSGISC